MNNLHIPGFEKADKQRDALFPETTERRLAIIHGAAMAAQGAVDKENPDIPYKLHIAEEAARTPVHHNLARPALAEVSVPAEPPVMSGEIASTHSNEALLEDARRKAAAAQREADDYADDSSTYFFNHGREDGRAPLATVQDLTTSTTLTATENNEYLDAIESQPYAA